MEHRYSLDTDRCICGGVVIYFEMPEVGLVGEGCEVDGKPWNHQESICICGHSEASHDGGECEPCALDAEWDDDGEGCQSFTLDDTMVSRKCELCGELIGANDQAEMYNPENPEADSVICHAECGIHHGLVVA